MDAVEEIREEMSGEELSLFFDEIRLLVTQIENRNKGDREQHTEELCHKLGMFMEGLYTLSNYETLSSHCKTLVKSSLESLMVLSQEIQRENVGYVPFLQPNIAVIDYSTSLVVSGKPGRPKYHISQDILLYFRNLGFNWKEIATMLCVSRWTVKRRVDGLDLS